MKMLLVAEYRQGQLLDNYTELLAFARELGGDAAFFLVGDPAGALPRGAGRIYLADVAAAGEYNPDVHKRLLLEAVGAENPDMIVFAHSSHGWDLAPRVAVALEAPQISEVVDIVDGKLVVPACNGKLRRTLALGSGVSVATLQSGAFTLAETTEDKPEVVPLSGDTQGRVTLLGYEQAERGGIDLTRAEVIVSGGRGLGKADNVALVAGLAKALGGEYAASRPVVDAEWVEHSRQVGTTGNSVSPKLYVACGISGAVQHLAGMKKAEFVVAVNTDREAPIGEVADIFAVADLTQLLPVLTDKLQA